MRTIVNVVPGSLASVCITFLRRGVSQVNSWVYPLDSFLHSIRKYCKQENLLAQCTLLKSRSYSLSKCNVCKLAMGRQPSDILLPCISPCHQGVWDSTPCCHLVYHEKHVLSLEFTSSVQEVYINRSFTHRLNILGLWSLGNLQHYLHNPNHTFSDVGRQTGIWYQIIFKR